MKPVTQLIMDFVHLKLSSDLGLLILGCFWIYRGDGKMVIESLFTGFINLVQASPLPATISLILGAGTKMYLGSVYYAILVFFVSFGILLAIL